MENTNVLQENSTKSFDYGMEDIFFNVPELKESLKKESDPNLLRTTLKNFGHVIILFLLFNSHSLYFNSVIRQLLFWFFFLGEVIMLHFFWLNEVFSVLSVVIGVALVIWVLFDMFRLKYNCDFYNTIVLQRIAELEDQVS